MNRFAPTLTLASLLLGSFSSEAAVIYNQADIATLLPSLPSIDLDKNGSIDIIIDPTSDSLFTTNGNHPFTIRAQGSSRIAVDGNIAASFSYGDQVNLSNLSFIDSSSTTLAGGFIYDSLGTPIAKGWGATIDAFSGALISPPQFSVDLFIVSLDDGVAWVDLGAPTPLGQFPASWGYIPNADISPESSFTISNIPEPASSSFLIVALSAYTARRRRTN